MTVIRPNSISGITSLTAHRGSIDFYAHDGSAARFDNINSNVTSGVSTFASLNITGDLDVGGALTYEDVTNIDSVGVITARNGIDVTGGSVGIGTDNPQDSLDVASAVPQIRLTDTSDGSYGQIRANGGNLILRADEGNSISDSVILAEIDGDEKFRITSTGRVGIGTDAPSRILDVAGSISIANNLVTTTNVSKVFLPSHNSANRGGKIRFGLEDGSFGGIEVENVAGSNGSFNSQTVHLINHNGAVAGDIKSLTARFDGRIGIGSENPQVDLAVRSGKASIAIAKDGLTVKDSGDLHTSYDTIQIGAGGGLASYSVATATADTQFTHNAYRHSGGNWKYRYTDTAARLRVNSPGRTWIFESAASGNADADITFTEQLRITSDGKLGIKVASPGCQTGGIHAVHDATEGTPTFTGGEVGIFQRNYNSSQGCHIGIIGGSSASSSINFGDKDDADVGIIQYAHSDNSMRLYVNTSERVRINQTGCLQVGEPTGTPGEVMQLRKASGDVEVISYAAPGSKTIFNCTGSNRFALERGYNSVFEIQDPNGNGVRSDLRFDGNIILNKNLGETNNSAVQLYRLIGPHNLSLANGMAILGSQTDTMSTKAARISTSNSSGTAWFGPYGSMHPGSYTAMFHMKVSNNSNTSTFIRIDVTGPGCTDAGGYGVHRPRSLNLAPSHFDNADRYQYIGLDFNFVNAVGSNTIEVRGLNYNNGMGADLYLDHILIVPRIPSHDG